MKKDWTYKKLGEVADTYRGLTYSKKDEVEHSSKAVLRSNNIDLTSHQLNFDEIKYIREDFVIPQDKLVKKDSIFICMSNGSMQHLGKVAYIDKEYNFAFGGFMGLVVPKEIVNAKYVYYSMLADNFLSTIMKEGKGANINNLRFSDVENYLIPIPPLSIQRSIVNELDLLHSVIEKKQEQLRALDNIAQSLFYQMFGDPITNPMGWQVKKLGEVCGIINGKNQKSVENPNGKYVICGSGGIMGRANDYICPENSVIIGRKGNINRPILMREKYWNVDTAFGLVPNTDSLLVDYLYIFTQEYDFEQLNVAVTIPSLRKTDIAEIDFPLPPLSLQQSFAAKVSAIEAQKRFISQSIKDVESLLAQRMDHYFG